MSFTDQQIYNDPLPVASFTDWLFDATKSLTDSRFNVINYMDEKK